MYYYFLSNFNNSDISNTVITKVMYFLFNKNKSKTATNFNIFLVNK